MKLFVTAILLCIWSSFAVASREDCEIQGRLAAVTTLHKSKGWTKEHVLTDLRKFMEAEKNFGSDETKNNIAEFVANVYDSVDATTKPREMDNKYYMECVLHTSPPGFPK